MRRSHRIISTLGALIAGVFSANVVHAQVRTNFENIALSDTSPVTVVLNILAWFLGITALVAVILVLYGGFLWLTSQGNEEKIEKAKQVLKNAVIGLLITMSAWGIVLYVINVFSDATGTNTTTGDGTGGSCRGCSIPSGGSTFGVLSTNPASSETDVVVCTDITVRMTDDVDQSSVNSETFSVRLSDGSAAGATCTANTDCSSSLCESGVCVGDVVDGVIGFAPGDTTDYFNFVPKRTFEQDVTYEVTVAGGSSGVQSFDSTDDGSGDSLSMSSSYTWTFTTGNDTDTTPPTVQISSSSPYPEDKATDVCLNTVINFDFSEPMRITTFTDDESFVVDQADTTSLIPDWSDGIGLKGWSFGGNFDYAQARPASLLEANTVYGVRLYAGDAANNFAGALTDSCGNPLDGDADGTAEGSTVDNYVGFDSAAGATETPITWTTGENAECTPIITSFTPSADYYGEYAGAREGEACSANSDCGSNSCVSNVCQGFGDTTLSIEGMYLAPHPEIQMEGSQIFASDDLYTCFNPDHLGNIAGNESIGDNCLDDELQTAATILLRTPVGAASSTPISVSVAGETSDVSATELTVLSPYIEGLSPNNGSIGQYITVAGANFSDDQGAGSVRMVSADGSRISTLTLPSACGDVWTESSIIVSAPETYTNADGSTGTWQTGDVAYIQVLNSSGRYSDLQEFTFNTVSRPNLCQVVDTCSNSGDSAFYVTGDNFGTAQGQSEVAFASDADTGYYADVTDWSNERINGKTQSEMAQDGYWVSVYDAETGQNSNAVQYEIPCSSAPQVVDISTCSAAEDIYPVPSPRPDTTDACINANIGVLFDKEMDQSTLSTSTIYLEQYNSGDEFDRSYTPLPVSAHMQTTDWSYQYNGNTYYGFQLNVDRTSVDSNQDGAADGTYSNNLAPNTWYQLTITTGVRSSESVALPETYTMIFKTDDTTTLCAVSSVDVSPAESIQNAAWIGTARAYETYTGSPYSAQCDLLDADTYSWNWSIDDTTIGDFGRGAGNVAAQKVYVAGDDSNNEGTATVTADVEAVSDDADFTVDLGYCDTDADCGSCSGSVCNEETHECSPVITSVSPDNGDSGTWVTLGGCMLGSDRGTVTMTTADSTVSAETVWPDEAICGDTWTNESVVVEVPAQYDSNADGTADTDLPDSSYRFTLTLPSGLSDASGDDYTVNANVHPGLCLIDPNIESEGGGVTAYGKGFGVDEGMATFHGVDDYDGNGSPDRVKVSQENTTWSETVIDAIVPSGAVTGRAQAGEDGFVVVTSGGDIDCTDSALCSNALDFTVTCDSSADCSSGVCDDSGVCVADDGVTTCSTDADCQTSSCSESTCSDAGICTPVITALQEDSGPNGGFTTIQGCYFGNYGVNSAVSFTNDTNGVATAEFPCTDSWSDSEIIVTIPDDASLPAGTTADVRVTTTESLTTSPDVFTVTNTCSNGAPIPASGVPLLCNVLSSTGRAGDQVTFSGDRQDASSQVDTFYNNQDGVDFVYVDSTETSATVPTSAETGPAQINVNSCVSNGVNFTITCDSVSDCADGQYCVDGTCTSDAAATCGSCTAGNSDSVCGTSQGCYYNDSESGYCCGSRPTIESVSVDNGDTNVCPNSEFLLEFSEGMTNTEAITISAVTDNGDGTYTVVSEQPVTITTNDAHTILTVVPNSLDTSTLYMLTINSSGDALAGQLNGVSTGLALEEGTQNYLFTTGTSTCAPDHVLLLNNETGESSYRFSAPSSTTGFTAYMMSSDDQYLAPTEDMNWEFTWDPYFDENRCDNIAWVDTTEDADATGESATSESQMIVSGEEHDKVETISAKASALNGWTGSLTDTATASTFFCQDGEAWEYIDESGNGSYISHAYEQHFRLIYCDTDDVPTLRATVQTGSSADDWFLQYLFINPDDENDAFGIRVYENSSHLSPQAWYAANVPNPGEPQDTTVDGYQAVRDGSSYYIAASNIDADTNGDGLDELYDNIYLITFNESDALSQISSDIIKYIRFNWNLSYATCDGSDKNKLVRDTRRVTDLGEIATLANEYYDTHSSYPYPQSDSFGSYIEELTTSVWSSWQGALGNVLGTTLPTDPYNIFYASEDNDPWNASETSWDYTGDDTTVQDCEYDPGSNKFYDETGTCWDPINTTFYCPENSHVYLWKVDPANTKDAQLYANLEYTSTSTESYINATGSDAPEPCSDVSPGSTCSCFNFMMSSAADPGGIWQ